MTDHDLPRQLARTARFSTGAPEHIGVAAAGRLVTYLRDGALWAFDPQNRSERLIGRADGYSCARVGSRAVVMRGSELWTADLVAGTLARFPVTAVEHVVIDPAGTRVAFVDDRTLRVIGIDGVDDRILAQPESGDVSWGVPEFAARMSMQRDTGVWWAPDGERLLAARVDESPVPMYWLADPAKPEIGDARSGRTRTRCRVR